MTQLAGDKQDAIFRIEHVYAGPAQLKGMGFLVEAHIGQGNHGDRFSSLSNDLQLGESGVWALANHPKKDRLVPLDALTSVLGWTSVYGPEFPGREGNSNRPGGQTTVGYQQVLEWARAVETVYRAGPPDRVRLLEGYCECKSPILVSWAMHLLGEQKAEKGPEFLRKLASRENLPVWTQVDLDHALVRADQASWLECPRRFQLLKQWAQGGFDSHDELYVGQRLVESAHAGEIQFAQTVRLVRTTLDSAKATESFKILMFGVAEDVRPKNGTERALALDLALHEWSTNSSEQTKVWLATYLGDLLPLSRNEARELTRRRNAGQESLLGQLLDIILRHNSMSPRQDGRLVQFDLLVIAIRKAKDQGTRKWAADRLTGLVPLDSDQAAILRRVKEEVPDPDVTSRLDLALQRVKDRK